MRTTEFTCDSCEKEIQITSKISDPFAEGSDCKNCNGHLVWTPKEVPLGRFHYDPKKAGKDTGVYEYDYGVRATWDLTVPNKIARLEKDGRIARNPFDQYQDDLDHGKVKPYESPVQEI